jgi:cellulose biosynthesis protein BcsQ
MRILLGGIKGGVGKTTIALVLGRRLARLGHRILIVDRDIIGWASKILGVSNEEGLLNCTLEGKRDCFNSLKIVNGVLGVVRFYPVAHTFRNSVNKVAENPKMLENVTETYREILKENFELFLVDNPPNVLPSDPVWSLEFKAFSLTLDTPNSFLFISDPTPFGMDAVVRYARYMQEDPEFIPFKHVGLVVNMVPPIPDQEAITMRKMREVCGEVGAEICTMIPFNDSLFNYGEREEDYPEEVDELAGEVANWIGS